jgi:large conductance mechanosensitive channel
MAQVLGDLVRRAGVLGFALAVALALAVVDLARALVYGFPMALIRKADGDLSFSIRDTSFSYYEALGTSLTLVLVAATLAPLWRACVDDTKRCPDCLSEIPVRASTCRYCTSEVGPSS